jgi:predicted nucleotidyltransferase
LLETAPRICYAKSKNRNDIIATLRAHEPELRHRGVLHAALFGSVARNEATLASDIDIMVEIDPEAQISLVEYIGTTHYLADLFPVHVDVDVDVDVANRRTLKPHVRPEAERDAVYAF